MNDDNIDLVLQRPIKSGLTRMDHEMAILQTKLDVFRVWWAWWWRHAGELETHDVTVLRGFCHGSHRSRFLAKEESFHSTLLFLLLNQEVFRHLLSFTMI